MTILVTGVTGKIGGRLAQVLHATGNTVIGMSRSGDCPGPFKVIKFDWFDRRTFVAPFDIDENIDRVFLVAPPVLDSFTFVKTFIDFAIWKGVHRFVFCTPSCAWQLNDTSNRIVEYLASSGVEYVVIRPAFLLENFNTLHRKSIQKQGQVFYSGREQKVAYVGVEDVVNASYEALCAKATSSNSVRVEGPRQYTLDEVAASLSSSLGKKIRHVRIAEQDLAKVFQDAGLSQDYASILASLQAGGAQEDIDTGMTMYRGTLSLQQFLQVLQDSSSEWMVGKSREATQPMRLPPLLVA